MYEIVLRHRFIFINSNLSELIQMIVCAHEIGHDRFHRGLAKSGVFQESMLYDLTRKPEYEANIFASELLIDDTDILDLISYDHDIVHIAGKLNVDTNLVLIKIDELRKRGYKVQAPCRPQSDFLGRK